MRRSIGCLALAGGLCAASAQAQTVRLQCFGNEPFWDVTLTEGWARLKAADQPNRDFTGKLQTHELAKVSHWRGKGASGELVVFVEERSCSDGMSDETHRFTARVSLGQDQWLLGCCRLPK